MATKDFDAMLAEKAGVRPTFIVAGQEFTARAKLPYKKFVRLMGALGADDADPDEATEKFFSTVIVKEDRERFLAVLNSEDDDDERIIDAAQINQITEWLLSIYTGKELTSSDSSSDGSSTTGRPRNVVSLSAKAN